LLCFLAFLQGIFVSPWWLTLLPLTAYFSSSYAHLLRLDKQISDKLVQVLDVASLARAGSHPASSLSQGFAPKGYVTDAPDMLESLLQGLGAQAGLLVLERGKTQFGDIDQTLLGLIDKALRDEKEYRTGTMPHYLAEPIKLEGEAIGAVALKLPAPLPPHLKSLLDTSIYTFGQLARYQRLRDNTTTLIDTVWPWRSRSSLNKIDALAMVGDLLATERGWLGALLETLPQAVFIMSPYGYSIYKNAAARRLFGDNKNMLAAIPEGLRIDAERFQQEYVSTVEKGEELELGLTERASGSPVLLTLKVVRDRAEVRGVAGVISDLSKIEELDRKRQEMIAMVVHDLRSPLTSIKGFAELLLGDARLNQDYLHIISSEAERMRRMTDVFLDVARLESDSFEMDISLSNLAELLRQAVAAVSSQAGQKDLIVVVHAPSFLIAEVDTDLISRMMVNLLSNAIKYSPAQTRIIASLKQQANEALIDIRDQGYGISAEQQSQLFQKYKRGDDEKARVGGTGLGLYLVKLVVDAHGGGVQVQSELEHGSTFSVRLPLTQTERRPVRQQEPFLAHKP
jgi:signal transduction histidine kinase